jgi:hypothetical protein
MLNDSPPNNTPSLSVDDNAKPGDLAPLVWLLLRLAGVLDERPPPADDVNR